MTFRSNNRHRSRYAWIAVAVVIAAAAALFTPENKPLLPESPAVSNAPHGTANEPKAPIPANEPVVRWPDGSMPIAKITATPQAAAPVIEFSEIAENVFSAQTQRYHAVISAESGLVYRPTCADANTKGTRLKVELTNVQRGAEVLFNAQSAKAEDDDTLVPDGAGRLSFWRADGFEEQFHARGDGIEQSFLLEEKPAGEGDLSFVCAIEADGLTPLPQNPQRTGGISFINESGQVAVRYGRIVVRDATTGPKQMTLALEPVLAADGKSLAFAVPGEWLERAQFPVVVDPLVGTDFQISPDNTTGIAPPSIAAGNNSFLVVWNDYRDGVTLPQLYGSVISSSGIASAGFPISAGVGFPRDYVSQRISVAFDGTNWLVVWADDRAPGGGVRGALVSSTGIVLGGNDFLIATTTGVVNESPLCAFNGADFVVAWQDAPSGVPGGSQVFFTRVTSSATVAGTQGIGSDFATLNQALFLLSPQKPNGDMLLVFRENNEIPEQFRSVRISPQGSVRDPGGTAIFKEDITDGGFGQPIGATFDTTDNQWHILSTPRQVTDSSVYLHKQNTDGLVTPPSGIFAEVGVGPTGSALDDYAAAFAGNNEWLFVRNEKVNTTTFHQIGKRVSFDRVDKDPVPFQIDTATQGALHSAVAAQSGNFYLVVWSDGRRSSSQPAQARNIFGAIVDTTFAGETGTALVPVISASPQSGEPPLTVSFDSAGSSTGADSLQWDFGDGTTSTLAKVDHIYRNRGVYIASLRLSKGPYSVIESVVIRVGSGNSNEEAIEIGDPLANSAGVVNEIFITSLATRLDFANANKDFLRVTGVLDRTLLPSNLTGLFVSMGVGAAIEPFALDANGTFKSDVTKTPLVTFSVNAKTGQFVYTSTNASLRDAFNALGAENGDVLESQKRIVSIPITVTIATKAATASVGGRYTAKLNVSGNIGYQFLGSGDEVSGSYQIEKFTVRENAGGRDGIKTHSYMAKGRLAQPGGGNYRPAVDGAFTFIFGNNVESIPSGQFVGANGKIKFKGRSGVRGVKKFTIDFVTGKFNLQVQQLAAEGTGGTGLPLAKSGENITRVDFNLSMRFDLADFPQLSAGRYVPLERKNSAAKGWTLR